MDTSFDIVLDALWLTTKVIFFGTLGAYLVTLGNPVEVRADLHGLRYLNMAPPTAVFRWRKPGGYEITYYNAVTDEEVVKSSLYQPIRWAPTYWLWRKKRPQSRDSMVRSALLVCLARQFFFVLFFMGSFFLIAWLAINEDRLWFVALGVLAVHQLAFARSKTYFRWGRPWLFVVIGSGSWVYLQGGVFETIAVCTVGALVTLAIQLQAHMATNWRFQRLREYEHGPFNPNRTRGRPW